ncbi:hypothetical protein FGIG_03210 [Fasciola gigantica]|uniref:Uncharacterized protein n=1 Tax=Fasciola gigantica TaxID=46835 RepID=A0A504YSN8_FASGI|nr:hypothetical protein FGIG_03210 [Fasciola gigantica]
MACSLPFFFTPWRTKQWIAYFLFCMSIMQYVSAVETGTTEAVTNPTEPENRIHKARRSALILLIFGLVFGLLNLVCCVVSIHKSMRDRKEIAHRNMIRRKVKEFAGSDHRRLLLGDLDRPSEREAHLALIVHQAVSQNVAKNQYATEALDMDHQVDFLLHSLHHPADSAVYHHYSRSPNLPRATRYADVHEDGSNTDEFGDFDDDTEANFNRLSAYPGGGRPPVASYDNI